MSAAITMATTNMAKAKGTATTIIAAEAIRDIIKHIETQEKTRPVLSTKRGRVFP
jgi:hypothetical protein